MKKDPASVPQDDKQALVQKVVDAVVKNKEVTSVNASVQLDSEWKYFASSEGSYIEQEVFTTSPQFTVTARKDGETRSRTFTGVPSTGGWEIAEAAQMVENAERIAAEAVEFCTAKPIDMGIKDLVLTPVARDADDPRDRRARHRARSHHGLRGQLRGHELREDLRHRQAEIRIEAVQRHRRSHDSRRRRHDRLRRRRRQDDRVPDRARRHPRRPADQPRIGAFHQRKSQPRLHVRQLVARLPVPADAERARGRRAGRDRRRPNRSSPTRRTAC